MNCATAHELKARFHELQTKGLHYCLYSHNATQRVAIHGKANSRHNRGNSRRYCRQFIHRSHNAVLRPRKTEQDASKTRRGEYADGSVHRRT